MTRIEACAQEIGNNYVEGYMGDIGAILTRHFGELESKLEAVKRHCQRRNNPACVTGTHQLAGELLRIIEAVDA